MEHVLLSDDGGTLVNGGERELVAFHLAASPGGTQLAPLWRFSTRREIATTCVLRDGRIAAGLGDGGLLVLGAPRAIAMAHSDAHHVLALRGPGSFAR
jgi:hypothetical protein